MAFAELRGGKVALDLNNAINYRDKESGEVKQRNTATALTDMIEEAGKVAAMEQGVVTMGFEVDGKYENYFVNRFEKDDGSFAITLTPTNDSKNEDKKIYVNSFKKEIEVNGEKRNSFYYRINDKTPSGERLVKSVGIQEYGNKDGSKSFYVKGNARIANANLKEALQEKSEGHLAILSKDGFRIVEKSEFANQKEKSQIEPQKSQDLAKTQEADKSLDLSR